MRGRAKANPHRTAERESEIPGVGIDYMWMTEEGDEEEKEEDMRGMPILVAIDEHTDWTGAWVVPEKGQDWYAIKALAGCIEDSGHDIIMLKSNQERAIIKLT